ncbi:DUF1552 domain-containing protein [Opitutales bacterium]|jgi:hypothetical protein|nr:DUF1552 domain-containing protein [Opitutales bacterium]
MHIAHSPLSRRAFLRGSGITLALPFLEAMCPVFGRAAKSAAGDSAVPRRMVCIQTNQGIMPQFFFPKQAGRGFALTPYLEKLAAHRDQITVLSGVSLPGVTGGHQAEKCFLTGTPHPEQNGFRNEISLDQFAAEQIGNRTRHPSLVLAMTTENKTLSYTRNGSPIPAENSPKRVFQKLFVQGSPAEVSVAVDALRQGRSMMDFLTEETARLNRTLSTADRSRLDQYLTSVRELEQRMKSSEAWEQKPKPVVKARQPDDITEGMRFVDKTGQIFDLVKLALETDSTRVISLFIDTTVIHNITHHGGRPKIVAELRDHEERQFGVLNNFLTTLAAAKEGESNLLDRTQILYGTCMGSANSHSNVNLPVFLAGGGFKHGQHLAFDTKHNHNLATLYVSMLQRLGIGTDAFASAKTTLKGLELA